MNLCGSKEKVLSKKKKTPSTVDTRRKKEERKETSRECQAELPQRGGAYVRRKPKETS